MVVEVGLKCGMLHKKRKQKLSGYGGVVAKERG